jgi:hypothetical protein
MNSREKDREVSTGDVLLSGKSSVRIVEIRLPRNENRTRTLSDSKMLNFSNRKARRVTTAVVSTGIKSVNGDNMLIRKRAVPQESI